MIRLDLHFELDYRIESPHGDFLFNLQPARTAAQRVLSERLVLSRELPWRSQAVPGPGGGNRLIRVRAPRGDFHLTYSASVAIEHRVDDPALLAEHAVDELPPEALPFLMPSRYCESDRLVALAEETFGALPHGHARVHAISTWVRRRVAYVPDASTPHTTATQTIAARAGVCRDHAHVMIALCRALSIPARYVTGTDYGADPAKAPDFHAYVEVLLGGRWVLFDPSGTGIPMGFVRIGTGRDAADVPFAMLFGDIRTPYAPWVRAIACDGPGLALPRHVDAALSTDGVEPVPPALAVSEPASVRAPAPAQASTASTALLALAPQIVVGDAPRLNAGATPAWRRRRPHAASRPAPVSSIAQVAGSGVGDGATESR